MKNTSKQIVQGVRYSLRYDDECIFKYSIYE